jgi:hypothetical protein
LLNEQGNLHRNKDAHYPKKSVPHIKDFYLKIWNLPDNDVLPQENPEQELERLQHQNALLSAQIYNETLRNQINQ